MHWPAEPIRSVPDEGSKRTVRRFAWLPTRVDEEEDPPMVVWLEFYFVYQEAIYGGYGGVSWTTIARYSGMPV